MIAVSLRAASAEEVRMGEGTAARRAEAARAFRRDLDDAVVRAKDALSKLPDDAADAVERARAG